MGRREKERWLRKTMVDKNDETDDRKRFTVRDSYTIDDPFFTPQIAVCHRHRKRHRDGMFFLHGRLPKGFCVIAILHVSKLSKRIVKVLLFYKSFRLNDSRLAALVCRPKHEMYSHI